jgi:hypothetical protein
VVDVAVVRLVRTDDQHHVAQGGVLGQPQYRLAISGAGTLALQPSSISAR